MTADPVFIVTEYGWERSAGSRIIFWPATRQLLRPATGLLTIDLNLRRSCPMKTWSKCGA
jgi:hypothetical protein